MIKVPLYEAFCSVHHGFIRIEVNGYLIDMVKIVKRQIINNILLTLTQINAYVQTVCRLPDIVNVDGCKRPGNC